MAGADEAGRGCLAGPLVGAAVLFDYAHMTRAARRALAGLHDSKQLDPEHRERLYPAILRAASRVAVTARSVREIDASGLHVTNIGVLTACLRRVAAPSAVCLVDGFRLPELGFDHRPIAGGDRRSAAIAAASVVAKVTRDRFMARADGAFPGWGFAEHVGYSTPAHRQAIGSRGISALHRRSFASVAYTQLDLSA